MWATSAGRALGLAGLALLLAGDAKAHPRGIHKRTTLTVRGGEVEVLITMDYDGGPRTRLLRLGADGDASGDLEEGERARLRDQLAEQALRGLSVRVEGVALEVRRSDAKLSLRKDARAGSSDGLSVAVLAKARLPESAGRGAELQVLERSPDRSHVPVEVFQQLGRDGGVRQEGRDLGPGEVLRVRLQALGGGRAGRPRDQ